MFSGSNLVGGNDLEVHLLAVHVPGRTLSSVEPSGQLRMASEDGSLPSYVRAAITVGVVKEKPRPDSSPERGLQYGTKD